MDKNAIKKYAVWARTELIDRVCQRAVRYEVTADANPNADSASGKVLTPIEKTQRQAAIARMRDKGYEYVIEEVAYTWFNRFAALRYMEVNNYLPSRVRVFTDENGSFKPQILTEAIHLNLDGLDMEKVYALKEAENNDELYKYLLITQCNALSAVLPQMFKPVDEKCKQEKDDYTILLFPDNLLREGSVVEQMVTLITEDNWLDAVQIIGWMYQYYNSEPKDKVFADLKKNIKITKENIPAATQLFTPDWIVRYMVENSLGRLWLEGHPQNAEELLPTESEQAAYIAGDRNSEDSKWHYYLKEAKQEADVQVQLAEIRKEYSALKPEDILCIDPCMGSGHIIVYMFDALMKIYAACGYSTRESVQSIIENNLYGLDIDDRAAQLAYFAVMMKAVQYDNRFLKRSEIPQPHVYSIKESNHLNRPTVEYFCNGDKKLTDAMHTLIEEMTDASEYGSILNVTQVDFVALYARFEEIKDDISMYRDIALNELLPFVQASEILAKKYDIAVTNPPYMGSSGMSAKLSDYVKANYPDSKSDLFAVFMERCGQMVKKNCYQAMITQHAWMFLSSFEKLRNKLLSLDTVNMVHLGARAFEEIGGEVVQTTSFVLRKSHIKGCNGVYCRLIEPTSQKGKEDMFLSASNNHDYAFDFAAYNSKETEYQESEIIDEVSIHKLQRIYYVISQKEFLKIPSEPIAYWVSPQFISAFEHKTIGDIAKPRQGLATGCNDIFIRQWYEVEKTKINFHATSLTDAMVSKKKWFPYNKGGEFRKWYGNNDYVVNWEDDGFLIRNFKNDKGKLRSRPQNTQFYFRECMSWSLISSGIASFRYKPFGHIFDIGGMSCFSDRHLKYLLALSNSPIAISALAILAPTINFQAGDIANIPVIIDKEKCDQIETLADDNIMLSKNDWDAFEVSWDFISHPLVGEFKSVSDAFDVWTEKSSLSFEKMKSNEETINRMFVEIYGLENELDAAVDSKYITIRRADIERDVRGLISYAVGCMFGRYSLDEDGLVYAGGEWDKSKYSTFAADRDGIIPICDDEYFDDDITGLFVKFVATVYGKDTLNENLKFIADALGGKGTPKEVIRNYFLNDFFADHGKMYQKRPIYWLFDSGKKNGFKALVYMHRYQPDTIARMRTDYVHEQQSRYRTAIADLENRIAGASTSERVRLTKQLSKLQDQSAELHTYEEKIHHLADRMIAIDLDDGVKHNYEIFKDVLAKIK